MEAQGQEATNEEITRLKNTVERILQAITDMELVLMEVTEHLETKTDLSSITTNTCTHFSK